MTPSTLIQLALGLIRLVSWITRQIERSQWEKAGYQRAMLDQLKAISLAVAGAERAYQEAEKATPEEIRRRLGDDT